MTTSVALHADEGKRLLVEEVDGENCVIPHVHVANTEPILVTVTGSATGGLTDDELRAAALHVVVDSMPAGASSLTDTELRAAPVPVSIDGLPLPAGAATDSGLGALYARLGDGSQRVSVDNFPASVAVTGAFFQATQPVSGPATDAQMRAAPIPISGTVTVNVGLTDTQLRAAPVPVSGTFFQVTQPVSAAALPLPAGASTEATLALIKAKTDNLDVALSTRAVTGLTDAQLRATAVPVSGTFFQVTQPVSAAALPLPAGASTEATLALIKAKTDNLDVALSTRAVTGLTDAQLRATAVPVSGTFFQATQPVSAAALPLPAGAATSALQTALNALFPATLGQKTMAAALAVSLASDQSAIPITPPTLTKGAQGATGFTTQDLKDAGRVLKTYTVSGLACVTAEALISLTPYADVVVGTAATTFGVTAGKRLRIQKITVTVRATSTVNVGGIVRLRLNAGTVAVASPVHDSIGCMCSNLATAVVGNAQSFVIPFPDGLELSGSMQFGLTQLFSATTATIDVHVTGYEY